jgi:hypothetical protein
MSEDKRWRWNRGARFAQTLQDPADEAWDDEWLTGLDQISDERSAQPLVSSRDQVSPDQVTAAVPELAAAQLELRRLEDTVSALEETLTRVRMAADATLGTLEQPPETASALSPTADPGGQDNKAERHLREPAGEGKGWPTPPSRE